MQLQLKNIGMIKEASIKIDGLTVITGENDTGKSTVGKALFFIREFKSLVQDINLNNFLSDEKIVLRDMKIIEQEVEKLNTKMDLLNDDIEDISDMQDIMSEMSRLLKLLDYWNKRIKFIESIKKLSKKDLDIFIENSRYNKLSKKFQTLFKFSIEENTEINIKDDTSSTKLGNKSFNTTGLSNKTVNIFIETPIIVNLFEFFSNIDTVQNDIKYNILNYPYILRSLYKQIKLELKDDSFIDNNKILDNLKNIINGELQVNFMGKLVFIRDNKEFNIQAIATGIKSFGILQMLIKNNYLNEDTVLILDEPEVHLHPQWQLEMAKIIVELVKNGVKIVVNSHSPYMIDALKYYADEFQVDNNFYLAEKNEDESSSINDVTMDLSPIFEKLTEPLRKLHKMKLGLS